jgi:hypothetical protein
MCCYAATYSILYRLEIEMFPKWNNSKEKKGKTYEVSKTS